MLTPPQALEALLFVAGEPIDKKDVAKLLGVELKQLKSVAAALEEELAGRGVVLLETEHELELRTTPEAAHFAKKLRDEEFERDLGRAGLETLAVIAYQNGATRGEIDWVRGVNSSASVRTLLMRGLIEGREDEADRRRMRYSLTADALAHLGARKVSDLPRFLELARESSEIIKKEEAEATAALTAA